MVHVAADSQVIVTFALPNILEVSEGNDIRWTVCPNFLTKAKRVSNQIYAEDLNAKIVNDFAAVEPLIDEPNLGPVGDRCYSLHDIILGVAAACRLA